MKNLLVIRISLILSLFVLNSCSLKQKNGQTEMDTQKSHRVLISSDIGGTDPDDFQSMAHLFLYADVLDIEGLIASPFGYGSVEDIYKVLNEYEKDYPNLVSYSDKYPSADSLRKITKQGAMDIAEYKGFGKATEGSEWIIKCARNDDSRPLHVLVWGLIEDVAQALHDAPDILPKLRVYYIGGPNKKWGSNAYQYIVDNHPNLWIIESNATYRGWFNGGNQSEEWSNSGFPEKYISGQGALGEFFMTQLGGTIKMGDTPSVAWLLKGNPENPSEPGWGGTYVRAWERPYLRLTRMSNKKDSMQEFGILELALPVGKNLPEEPEALLHVSNQSLKGYFSEDDTVRFRFCPKGSNSFSFKISSNVSELNGKTGGVTSFMPSANLVDKPSEKHPNWWTDDPSPEVAEGNHIGAKTVNQWREEFLTDFANRMQRCQQKAIQK